MAYTRKTKDEWQLLINYGYDHGYEAVCQESDFNAIKQRRREYRENDTYARGIKIKKIRVPI